MLDPPDFRLLLTLMFRGLNGIPDEIMRIIWFAYLKIRAQMIQEQTDDRNRLRDLLDEAGF